MSAGPQPLPERNADQGVLGECSLAEPAPHHLRCSLELSVEEAAGSSRSTVSAALEQTDRVIGDGAGQLMREYLGHRGPPRPADPVPLALLRPWLTNFCRSC